MINWYKYSEELPKYIGVYYIVIYEDKTIDRLFYWSVNSFFREGFHPEFQQVKKPIIYWAEDFDIFNYIPSPLPAI